MWLTQFLEGLSTGRICGPGSQDLRGCLEPEEFPVGCVGTTLP